MLAFRKTDVVQEEAWGVLVLLGMWGRDGGSTSDGFANEGIAEVGIGGSV